MVQALNDRCEYRDDGGFQEWSTDRLEACVKRDYVKCCYVIGEGSQVESDTCKSCYNLLKQKDWIRILLNQPTQESHNGILEIVTSLEKKIDRIMVHLGLY